VHTNFAEARLLERKRAKPNTQTLIIVKYSTIQLLIPLCAPATPLDALHQTAFSNPYSGFFIYNDVLHKFLWFLNFLNFRLKSKCVSIRFD
jgi:hypothetical protein